VSRFQAPWHDWIGSECGLWDGKSWHDLGNRDAIQLLPHQVSLERDWSQRLFRQNRAAIVQNRDTIFGLQWLVFKWVLQHFWMRAEARGLGFTKGGTWGLSIFVRRVSRVGINIVNTLGSEINSLEGSKASFVYSLVRFIWEWWGKQMVEIREKADFL